MQAREKETKKKQMNITTHEKMPNIKESYNKLPLLWMDVNEKLGREQDSEIVGKYGLRSRNDRRGKWFQLFQIIANTWFKEHRIMLVDLAKQRRRHENLDRRAG